MTGDLSHAEMGMIHPTAPHLGPTVLVVGDPISGITIIGPFNSSRKAADYAERDQMLRNETWWIAPLTGPTADTDGAS